MPKLITTVTDTVDSMMRRLGGQRLCEHCNHWAKKPHQSGTFYFCDSIHASIYYKKQQDLMKQALEKKRSLEKERHLERMKRQENGDLDIDAGPKKDGGPTPQRLSREPKDDS